MGNLGCGCSEFQKEEVALDNLLNSDFEEVIEFQPDKYKQPSQFSTPGKLLIESLKSEDLSKDSATSETLIMELQGELMRVQQSQKEIFVPR